MIDRDGNAKIVVFGAAYVQGFDELDQVVRETHPPGSVGYVAPECLAGHGATHAIRFAGDLVCVLLREEERCGTSARVVVPQVRMPTLVSSG